MSQTAIILFLYKDVRCLEIKKCAAGTYSLSLPYPGASELTVILNSKLSWWYSIMHESMACCQEQWQAVGEGSKFRIVFEILL